MFHLLLLLTIILSCLIYLYYKTSLKKNRRTLIKEFKQNIFTIVPAKRKDAILIFKNMLKTDYVKNLSKFDLMSKTQNKNAILKIEYIQFAIRQIQEWTSEETKILYQYYHKFINTIIDLNLQSMWKYMPSTINIIKSTMKHEGNASGYTINNNIVLKHLDYDLFVHEMFHVFSRYNHRVAENLYKIFKIWVADKLVLPHHSKIKDLIISNPDTPLIVFTEVEIKKQKVLVTPILHSKKEFNNDTSFFDNMNVSLLFVEVRIYDGKVILVPRDMKAFGINSYFIDMKEVNEYIQKLGQNTDYNIHPEEVCAKQFEFIFNNTWKQKKQPELIEKMLTLLQKTYSSSNDA